MVSVLLLILECLKELFLIVVVGGFTAIASAGVVVYILSKLLGVDRLQQLLELETKVDLLLAKEYLSQLDEEDYVVTEDGEKIPYDEDTQE